MNKFLVSIIIPVYNESRNIGNCLDSILANKNREEIIVVNDGSTDDTVKIVNNYVKKHAQIKLINKTKNSGIVEALKTGIKKAKGEIIIKTDADAIVDQNWLKKIEKHFQNKEVVAISGGYHPARETITGRALTTINELFNNKLQRFFSTSKMIGANWAARKNLLLKLRLLDNKKTDEKLFFDLKKQGKIIYDPKLTLTTRKPETLIELWQTKFKWGRNAIADGYYQYAKFWIRPVYFLFFILSVILINDLIGQIMFLIALSPLLITFLFSLWSESELALVNPLILLFSEFAWLCGVIRESFNLKKTKNV